MKLRFPRLPRNFARAQYRRMLVTTLIGAVVTFVTDIADTVLAGHLFGGDALAGVNLVMPITSLVLFLANTVTCGAAICRSIAVGRCDRAEMDRCCSTCLWASLALAVALGAMFLGADAYFSILGVTGAARDVASAYCRGYWAVAALTPVFLLAYDLIASDGGHRCCRIGLLVNGAVKLLAAIPLARRFGIVGLAYSSVLGQAVSIAIMAFHLRAETCSLRFAGGFSLRTFLLGVKFSVLDQLYMFGDMLKTLVVNAFVIASFGERFLPVVSVFTAVSMLSLVQSATASAAQPLIGIYLGERNYKRVRTVAGFGLIATLACGLALSAFLLAYPDLVSAFVGLTDPDLLPSARTAVRFAAAFLMFTLVCGFMDSYYLYTERFLLSFVLVLADGCLAPVVLGVALGWAFDSAGFWLGLSAAPAAVLAVLLVFAHVRRGNPFLLPTDRDARTFVFDLELTERDIAATSELVMEHLQMRGLYAGEAVKAPLIVEEALMIVRERNAGKRILGEVTLDLNDGVSLTLRDDGEIFDLTDSDAGVSSLRSYLVANVMANQRQKFNLVATGTNRNCFQF